LLEEVAGREKHVVAFVVEELALEGLLRRECG
jgi:hypothetical protein